ncbi:site-specific integrase [Salegentibacter salinarum]|uniref:hypothetical protein n=1 Tax=Salegentibacter salinarum TaxID=447422 RepID=UPI00117B9D2E|nr:hypothetical protein [Salegentibacter salinarum]
MEKLKNEVVGQKWIFTSRNKTKAKVKIPFLDKALEILEKYDEHPMTEITQITISNVEFVLMGRKERY